MIVVARCSFPVLSKATVSSENLSTSSLIDSARRAEALALQYSTQLKDLIGAEQKLKVRALLHRSSWKETSVSHFAYSLY